MSLQLSIPCVNCGTALEPLARGATSVRCPVCGFLNDLSAPAQALAFTRDSLESSLGDLISRARAGGLTSDEILAALRDELEFAAELASGGRRIFVQIVDLGPHEGPAAPQPTRDRAVALRGRALGG